LPAARRERYVSEVGLRPDQAHILAGDRAWAVFFEQAVELGADPKSVANWMTQDLAGALNESRSELTDTKVTPKHIADIVRLVADGTVSGSGAKQVLAEVMATGAEAASIVDDKDLRQVSDTGALASIVDQVIADNPGPVEQFRGGKEGVIGFLVGAVMKASGGSANPKVVQELLRERLAG